MAFVEGLVGSVAGSEATKTPAKGKATKGSGLSAKWHGIPVWLLAAGGGFGVILLYRYYKNQQANSAGAATSTAPTAATGSDTGLSGGGSSGGGGGGLFRGIGGGGSAGPVFTSPPSSFAPTTVTSSSAPAPSPAPAIIPTVSASPQGGSSVSTGNVNAPVISQLAPALAGVSQTGNIPGAIVPTNTGATNAVQNTPANAPAIVGGAGMGQGAAVLSPSTAPQENLAQLQQTILANEIAAEGNAQTQPASQPIAKTVQVTPPPTRTNPTPQAQTVSTSPAEGHVGINPG